MRRLLSLYLLPSTLYPYHTFNKVPIIPRSRRNGIYIPLATPATAVVLPNGATLDITIYQAIVLTLGALIFIGALVCAAWTTGTSRGVLVVAAVLPALTLVVFRAQAPMLQKFPIGGCDRIRASPSRTCAVPAHCSWHSSG